MIILHKKKIIIFHNRKTSGTSFGILMSLISEKSDNISFHPVDIDVNNKVKKKISLGKNQSILRVIFWDSFKNIIYNILLFFLKLSKKYKNKKYKVPFIIYKSKYYAHTTPEDFQKNISFKIYNEYSKFATYRKFSEQIYSMYNHLMSYSPFMTYENWVKKNLDNFYEESLKFYKKDILYFNFHKMENSLKTFCKMFEIREDLYKYYKNIKQRTKNKKYPNFLSHKLRKKILSREQKIYKMIEKQLLSK